MADTIKISGIRAFGYHGVLAHERNQGQEFSVDVEVTTDFSKAVINDALGETINYALIADVVYAAITGSPVNLIEITDCP